MPQRLLPFTLAQMHYFLEVGRWENMTAAAERMNVSQPTISASIKQLERALDTQLFIRTGAHRLRLTSAGRSLLREAEHLVHRANQIDERVKTLRGEVSGEMVIGVFSPIAPFRVSELLREFGKQYPLVSLNFVDGNQPSLQRKLLEGECDVAILYGFDLDSRIRAAVLDRVSPYVLLPTQHRLASVDDAIRLDDLVGEPYILLDLPHSRERYMELFAWAGVAPSVRYRLDSFESVRSFVGSGHGYTILHQGRGVRHTYSGGTVVSRSILGGPPQLEIVAGIAARGVPTVKIQAFLRIAKRVFARTA